ncbi:MAG: ABC transporter ATP-binding protein, partial [candidate division NC10 bacterium]|nr:ABC transporter ATP-binding protein [candidate division NC10 bacterium]
GLVTPEEGEIRINGDTLFAAGQANVPVHRRRIGYLFQHYALFPHLSVCQNILFGADRHDRETEERLARLLHMTRLAGLESRYPRQLSGGQQQRVALARTLVVEPRVLLLDEPLSNLDAKLREQMGLELTRIQRELGITTIYVTHDQEEALALSTRIAVMDGGRIIQQGTPQEVYHRPARRFVAEFVGVSNVFAGIVREASPGRLVAEVPGVGLLHVALEDSTPPQPGAPVLLSVRPEAMALRPPGEGSPAGNTAAGVVRAGTFQGAAVQYEVLLGSGQPVRVNAATPKGQRLFPPGAEVAVCFDPSDVTLIPQEDR